MIADKIFYDTSIIKKILIKDLKKFDVWDKLYI